MSLTVRRMTREFGTAFAVLAIYVLVLLAPLHQAAGLQRDLGKLGFETVAEWSICAPLAQDQDGDPTTPLVAKCPAAGIAKHDFAAVLPVVAAFTAPTLPAIRYSIAPASAGHASLHEHFGQSRAPPVTV